MGKIERLKDEADTTLIAVLGASGYMHACALLRELDGLVGELEPPKAAAALSAFNSLVALKYAERRRDA